MGDKFEVLLKLNNIMKQQAEKKLADVVFAATKISDSIEKTRKDIERNHTSLFIGSETSFLQTDVIVFEQWKSAQLNRISSLQLDLQQIAELKKTLLEDLKTQTSRRNVLLSQQAAIRKRVLAEKDEIEAERNLEGWLNQNRFADTIKAGNTL